ncbi:hypothetical protein [Streptomyces sp. NPDC058254]|uniref:hypothetical protein n=1 Tax=Streptomyces sp. NPDC058254 TaxID=3346406 RepID=UPI0036EBC742
MHPPRGVTGTGGSSGTVNRSPSYRASPNRKPGIGVPQSDSRDALTSQRARATIASAPAGLRTLPVLRPKHSTRGQLLAVKDSIDQMLQQFDLTNDELEASKKTAKRHRSRRTPRGHPTPAGPTPRELGTTDGFIPLPRLMKTITRPNGEDPK